MNLGGPELAILVLVVLVLFGPDRIPKVARSIGKARREFEQATADADADGPAPQPEHAPERAPSDRAIGDADVRTAGPEAVDQDGS